MLRTEVPVRCCGERKVLRRLAGLDGSQGTSADNEVAVVGNSRSESRSVAGTNRNRGRRLEVVVMTLSS